MGHNSELNMATGIQNLMVKCVALTPFLATFIGYIISWANGSSSLLDRENVGIDTWDHTALVIWLFFLLVVPIVSLYCVNGLGRTLQKFASDFNARLRNLASAGKN